VLLKASSITNLTDARYFAAREVDFLGFNLEAGTPGYLDPIFMRAIREWVEGPVVVGEFGQTPVEVVREAAQFYGLEAVELTAVSGGWRLPAGSLDGLTVVLDVSRLAAEREALAELLAATAQQVGWFAVAFAADDEAWREPFWRDLCRAYPFLVQFDLPAGEWRAAVDGLQPAGLILRGGEEERVGIKSFDELEAIFEALER
jgi:phosphoribosylanthranilate isomerase